MSEPWEDELAKRGYRKSARGKSMYATALYQRNVTQRGSDGLFFNFDRHDDPDFGVGLTGWMQIRRADGRCVNVEQFAFKPGEIIQQLDTIEAEWFAIVRMSPVDEDQQV